MDVIFIHGCVASGKHTIGTKLSEQTGLPLFHNHLAVDAAKSLFAFGTPSFVRLRAAIWQTAFAEAAVTELSFIFTFNPEATVDPALIAELCESVEVVGGRVQFVRLDCSRESIMERLGNASRGKFGKLTDRDLYATLEAQGAFTFPSLPDPVLIIDTDTVGPDAAARMIATALALGANSAS